MHSRRIEENTDGPTPWPTPGGQSSPSGNAASEPAFDLDQRQESLPAPPGEETAFIRFLQRHWPRRTTATVLPEDNDSSNEPHEASLRARPIGRFQVRRELGKGGFGTVYQAFDPQLGRDVAIKVPHPETAYSDDLRRRFEREARAAASLDHPHINPIYETSHDATDLYIASHYCGGPTLAEWLKRRLAPVSPQSAARLVAALAGALHHAHERGILHRDLKPSNVLLDPLDQIANPGTGQIEFEGYVPKLSDFGLAKILEEVLIDDRTRTGVLLGTPRYMAPEQTVGDFSNISPRTDVYALGVMLYELLVGRPPFVGDTELETLRQVKSDEPISIRRLQPNVPRDLDTICMKSLEKDPGRRYSSAEALAADLGSYLSGSAIRARPRSLARRARLWSRGHPLQAIVLLTGLSVALGVPATLTWHTVGLEREIRVAETERLKAKRFEAQAVASAQVASANAAHVEQHVYASDMRLANQLLKEGEFTAAAGLIDRHKPRLVGGADRRGFEWWYSRPFGEMTRHTWQAHDGELSLLAFSADGKVLLTASDAEGRAKTWNLSSNSPSAEVPMTKLAGRRDRCAGALSADGNMAAAATAMNLVKVWDAHTGKIQAELRHADRVRCVAFSPDGRRLLTGGDDASRIWRCGAWKSPEREVHDSRAAQFSPDGRTLAIVWSPAWAAHVRILDAETFVEKRAMDMGQPVLDAAISPDGRMLSALVDSPRGTDIGIFNPDTGAWLRNVQWQDARVRGVSFSGDGELLAAVAFDGGLRFWKTASGRLAGGLRGAGGRITQFAFSADNRWLATSAGGAVSLWDRHLVGGPAPLEVSAACAAPVVFSPVDDRVAVANADHSIMLIDPATAKVTLRLKGHYDPIADIAYTYDGQRLASVDRRHLRVWNARDGRLLWQADAVGIGCVAWSPDGDTLATGGLDHLVTLWDAGQGVRRVTLEGHTEAVRSLRFTPDGKRLISLGRGNFVRTWDIARGQQLGTPYVGESLTVGIAVARESPLVATLSYNGKSTLFKFDELGSLEQFGPTFDWPKGFVPWFLDQPANLILSADGAVLGRAGVGDIFSADDTSTGARRYALSGRGIAPTSVAFSPDGRTLAAVSRWNELTFWDTSSWRGRRVLGAPLAAVRSLAFSPDSKTLLTACDNAPDEHQRGYSDFPAAPNVRLPIAPDNSATSRLPPRHRDLVPWQSTADSLRLWDVESGAEQHAIAADATLTMLPSAAWSRQCNLLAAVAADGTLWAWDMQRREIVARRILDDRLERAIRDARDKTPPLVPQSALAGGGVRPLVALSPDGLRAATVDPSGMVQLWETDGWRATATLSDKAAGRASLFFSPDGTTLVVTRGSQARLYDPHSAELRRTLRSEGEPQVLCGGFTTDGKTLALGTIAGNVKCYDLATGAPVTTLVGHVDGISSLCYSPDGRNLATGSWDTTVRLWDVASEREVAVLEGHQGRVHAVAFSPEGEVLASGGEIENGLGEVYLWRGKRTGSTSTPDPQVP